MSNDTINLMFYTDGDPSVGVPGDEMTVTVYSAWWDLWDEEERAGFISDMKDTLRQWMDGGSVRCDYDYKEATP